MLVAPEVVGSNHVVTKIFFEHFCELWRLNPTLIIGSLNPQLRPKVESATYFGNRTSLYDVLRVKPYLWHYFGVEIESHMDP